MPKSSEKRDKQKTVNASLVTMSKKIIKCLHILNRKKQPIYKGFKLLKDGLMLDNRSAISSNHLKDSFVFDPNEIMRAFT